MNAPDLIERIENFVYDDISLGQSARTVRTLTLADIQAFAAVSGDTNPVHINAEAAERTMFKQRIAHGMLSASLISTVLGTKLPGPGTIYLTQNLKFRAPVTIGATVTATVEVTALDPARKRATLATTCTVGGRPVIEGDATVMVPSRAG